jgi:hypothetical protein
MAIDLGSSSEKLSELARLPAGISVTTVPNKG